MEEINIKELFDYFKERIMLFAIIVLSILVVGSTYTILLKTPMYRSNSTLLFVEGNASSVQNYKEIVTSQRVVDPVIESLNLKCSGDDLKGRIEVTTKNNISTIVISVADKDKKLAVDITKEVTKLFKQEMQKIYNIKNIQDLDTPKEASAPYNMNVAKDLVIYLAVGIIIGIVSIFIIYYFDTTIKSAEEVEKKYNLPIFGVIPKVKTKEK